MAETAYTIGGVAQTVANADAEAASGYDFSFTNTLPNTDISAKKNWPEGQTVPANTTVQLTLSATVPGEGENAEPVVHTISSSVTTVVTLNGTESPAWTHTWNDLPKYDTAGKLITYTVAETAYTIGGVEQTAANADAEAASGYDFSFTNELPSTNIRIVKVKHESNPEVRLSGAKFQLKKDDGTGNYVNVRDEVTIPASGEYTFSDLADGQYKLVEIQPPAGYNMMSQEIIFTITGGTVTTENSSSITTVTYTAVQEAVADDPATTDVNEAQDAVPATFIVGNIPGVELPATGGSGTTLYTVTGLSLMAAALWLILRRKREAA